MMFTTTRCHVHTESALYVFQTVASPKESVTVSLNSLGDGSSLQQTLPHSSQSLKAICHIEFGPFL